MRLMTWNVNGIKTLLQYSPWNALKSYEAILNELGADIICFQETKITKKQIERSMAILPSFDSFFSSYSRKPEKGYSGTCVFTKKTTTVPRKAEEGLSGRLPRHNGAEAEEAIDGAPQEHDVALNPADVKAIDSEGRTTMVDLGLFVLINLYCPNETNEERLDFKLAFNSLLEARVQNLVRSGRQVVVLGDLNIAAKPIDHCDPVRRSKDSPHGGYEDHPARKWFNEFIGEGGTMVDLGRHFHPNTKSMFTHWETRINARETNYGSRIDYILATPGLLPWIKGCEIQPQVYGSDHCPVIADFHESIEDESGHTLHIWDLINPPGRPRDEAGQGVHVDLPRLAARHFPAFGKEQRLLSNFFSKGSPNPEGRPPSVKPDPVQRSPERAERTEQRPSMPTSAAGSKGECTVNRPDEVNAVVRETAQAGLSTIDLTAGDSDEEPGSVATGISPPKPSDPTKGAPTKANTKTKPNKLSQRAGQMSLAGFVTVRSKSPQDFVVEAKPKQSGRPRGGTSHKQIAGSAASRKRKVQDDTIAVDSDEDAEETFSPRATKQRLKEKLLGVQAQSTAEAPPQEQPTSTSTTEEAATIDTSTPSHELTQSPGKLATWSTIFATKTPPLCTAHGEPCKQWTVNKSGKNKGRAFWLCNRPVGEGYDNGQRSGPVNPEYRCNYFKWESDVKRSGNQAT